MVKSPKTFKSGKGELKAYFQAGSDLAASDGIIQIRKRAFFSIKKPRREKHKKRRGEKKRGEDKEEKKRRKEEESVV